MCHSSYDIDQLVRHNGVALAWPKGSRSTHTHNLDGDQLATGWNTKDYSTHLSMPAVILSQKAYPRLSPLAGCFW